MSSHGFQSGSGGSSEERQDEGQRSGQQQEETKSESVVRPTAQQQMAPAPHQSPHPAQAQLNQPQSVLRTPGQPVAPSVLPSQPPTETVKPYVDTLTKSSTMYTTRPLAPAPAPTISAVPKITAGHVTVMETSISSMSGLPPQQATAITTALSLPTPPTIHLPAAAAMMKGIQTPSTQVPNHPYPSHVPRGIAAAAAISIPKAGSTTAILRPHTQTIGGTTGSTTTVQSVLASPIIPPYAHPQRYSPATVSSSTAVHSCSAQGIARSSSPAVTIATVPSEIHRSGHHLPHTLGMTLQPRPLPTPQPQPHLQPQTQHQVLTQVPTLLQSQNQTQPQVSHTPPIQLQGSQFVPQIRQQLQQDLALARTLSVPPHVPKYVTSVTLPSNIPKPIISATPNVTSMPTTQPSQQPAVTVVSSVSTTSGPPHTVSVTSVPAVLTSAPIQLGSMFAAVRTTTAVSAVSVTNTSTTQATTPATAPSIPIAKVAPRQQLPHSPRSQPEYETSGLYLPVAPTHRGSPNPVVAASVAAAVSLAQTAATTDGRSERPLQAFPQTTPYPSGIPPAYYYHPADPTAVASYHHMNPYLTSISAGAVRPIVGFNPLPVSSAPQGTQNMAAAAVAAAAHAATVGAAPLRIGPLHSWNCMATVQGTVTTTTTNEAMDTSVAVTSMYSTGIMANVNTTAATAVSSNLPNPSASPRPSILRKRTNDSVRKPVVNTGSQPDSPKTDSSQSTLSATSSPKPSDILNFSQHSSEVNVVDNSTNTSSVVNEIKIKREPLTPSPTEGALQVNTTTSLVPSIASTVTTETIGASPRKKPRKQQHVIATEDHDMMESNSTDEADENEQKPPKMSKKMEKTKDDSKKTAKDVKYIQYLKRPYKNLIDSYRQPWNPAHNHFQRYGEVKVKDKKPSIQEIAGQKGVIQKASGWKIQHIASQLDDLANLEQDVFSKMKEIKEGIGPCKENTVTSDDDMFQVAELVQGNIQRCKLAMEQMSEARHSMIKLLDHKQKVVSLLNKHTNKRSSKKKSSSST